MKNNLYILTIKIKFSLIIKNVFMLNLNLSIGLVISLVFIRLFLMLIDYECKNSKDY